MTLCLRAEDGAVNDRVDDNALDRLPRDDQREPGIVEHLGRIAELQVRLFAALDPSEVGRMDTEPGADLGDRLAPRTAYVAERAANAPRDALGASRLLVGEGDGGHRSALRSEAIRTLGASLTVANGNGSIATSFLTSFTSSDSGMRQRRVSRAHTSPAASSIAYSFAIAISTPAVNFLMFKRAKASSASAFTTDCASSTACSSASCCAKSSAFAARYSALIAAIVASVAARVAR